MTKTYNIDVEWEIDENNPPKRKLPTKVKNAKIEIDEDGDVLQQIEDWLADRYGCRPGSFYAGEIENPPKPEPRIIGFGTDFGLKRSGTIVTVIDRSYRDVEVVMQQVLVPIDAGKLLDRLQSGVQKRLDALRERTDESIRKAVLDEAAACRVSAVVPNQITVYG